MVFYAVAVGRSTGVFTTWDECHKQVNGFSGCLFEKYETQVEAEAFVDRNKPVEDNEEECYYAVAAGRTPGVYKSWGECHKQVNGFSGCTFKTFKTQGEAEAFVDRNKPVEDKEEECYYAVAAGRTPGVYKSWGECQVQVDGFSGCTFKKFKTQEGAESFIDKYNQAKEQEDGLIATLEMLTTTDD